MPAADELHRTVQTRIREQRTRLPDRLTPAFDELVDRHGFLADDTALYFHPLIQPIVTFPVWIAESSIITDAHRHEVGDTTVVDLVEATVMGYLYVRVHDDLLDEGLGRMPEAMYLADSFLVRHAAVLAQHNSTTRFWDFHAETFAAYADAMLLERAVSDPQRDYTESDFDRVLQRSQPLMLAGALLLDGADRWDRVDELQRFIHHVVRAGQIVDDIIDCERDVAAGNHTWVARRLGSIEAPERMAEQLILGRLDELVEIVERDLDVATDAADELGMPRAVAWIAERRAAVRGLSNQIIRSALMG